MARTSIFDTYETDRTSEEDGKWFDEEFGPEVKMKLRRYTSAKSRKARESIFKAVIKQYKTLDKVPEDITTDLTNRHMAEAIITDWSGIFGKDGNEIVYSAPAAYDLLSKLPDLARDIVLLSINMDNYKAEKKAEVLGN